jgi:hypothetical protein
MMCSSFVANRQSAWLLYTQAKTWSVRPSDLLNIDDWYTSYCLDQAIAYWGTFVETELDRIEGDKPKVVEQKRKAKLHELLGTEGETPSGQFADPALMFS